jgi:putative oxidoreductase
MDWIYTLARVLLPVLFIVEGVGQFANIHDLAQKLAAFHWPLQAQLEMLGANRFVMMAYAAALIEVVGGLLVIVGFQARIAAGVLAAFTIGTIVIGDPFWQAEGRMRALFLTDALKNLSIIAGLLMVVAKGPGLLSIDLWRRRY